MEPLEIYSLIQSFVSKEIDDKIKKHANDAQFKVTDIPIHSHTGVDAPRIEFNDITGVDIMASDPLDSPENGTVRLYDAGGTRRIYAFINGTWRYSNLT